MLQLGEAASDNKAGVLIYTADGDSEGSLGGLVRQGRKDKIIDTINHAIIKGGWCSNDPICSELPEHGLERLNLTACHACGLLAETSCTHLNLLLDRQLVNGKGDNEINGFFGEIIY